MNQHHDDATFFQKLRWSIPWLVRYPFWRAGEVVRRLNEPTGPTHVIFLVANHWEPGTGAQAIPRVEHWMKMARETGNAIRDRDGMAFRHTNFYPAEQYERPLLEMLSALQAEGFCEVEIHLHHGVEAPDTAENTRRILTEFRDTLAEEHKCLSRESPMDPVKYAFVHGNWALANSAGGRWCGVDSEMEILAETGCYADFTLPSVPHQAQVARINAIYTCGKPLDQVKPHRSGPTVVTGKQPSLPIIFEGPLAFDWTRRLHSLPVPRLDDGSLAQNYPLTLKRFNRWRNVRVSVAGRPDWVFVKLYSHGFFDWDQDAMIGPQMRRFMTEVLEFSEKSKEFFVYFASAREAFNIVMAAVDGHSGSPGQYRNYKLRQIMEINSKNAQRALG
ncbi:MAG TPA: hypothetical protein VF075_06855 [Pyrinomonadaceae bacterium]